MTAPTPRLTSYSDRERKLCADRDSARFQRDEARAINERLRRDLLNVCPCDPDPDSPDCGPLEQCPIHGRLPYAVTRLSQGGLYWDRLHESDPAHAGRAAERETLTRAGDIDDQQLETMTASLQAAVDTALDSLAVLVGQLDVLHDEATRRANEHAKGAGHGRL